MWLSVDFVNTKQMPSSVDSQADKVKICIYIKKKDFKTENLSLNLK